MKKRWKEEKSLKTVKSILDNNLAKAEDYITRLVG